MSLDLNKIRERLTNLKSNGGKSSQFWRPQEGETKVRIVPTADGDPFKDYYFHYNVGKNPGFLCPKRNYGEDCAVCDFATKLYKDGTTESIKEAKNLFVRQRFFTPVLVRGEEDEGVKVWGFGKMAYENLLSLVLNPEYGDITDVEAGTDLTIGYGKPPGTPRRKSSSLCDEMDPKRCAELLESIPDFESLFDRKSPQEVSALLNEFILNDTDAEEVSSELQAYNKSNNKGTKESSVEAAFNELINA